MSGCLRKAGLAGLVLALHVGGLAMLSWVAPARFTPALEIPIQVALIREAAPSPPAAAPTPQPPVELPVQAAPPKVQPTPPKPRPQAVAKPAPAKPAEPVPTTTAETAVATEAPAPAAPAPAAPISAPAPAATSAAAPVTAARFDADYLNNPTPPYPPLSRRMREEGKVVLKVLVSSVGLPARIELSRSSGSERLDRAGELAVSHWKFIAARQGDQAIESWVLVPIIFKLEN